MNEFRDALRSGVVTLGAWCRLPGSVGAELLARQGFDYIGVDAQHGMIDFSVAVPMLQGINCAGSSPLVRVPSNNPADIGRYLDAGAHGIIVPLVNTAEEAEAVVSACRYAPNGSRSFGPLRATDVVGSERLSDLQDVAVIVMVETARAVTNVAAIAATPGIDVVYIGPSDLACSFGLEPSQSPHPQVEEAIAAVRTACDEAGIVTGIQCPDSDSAIRRLEQGFRMVTVVQDVLLMRRGANEHLSRVRDFTVREPVGASGGR